MSTDLSSCTVHADLNGLLILSWLCSTNTMMGSHIEIEVLHDFRLLLGLLSKYYYVNIHLYYVGTVGGRNAKQITTTTSVYQCYYIYKLLCSYHESQVIPQHHIYH